jgi:hypothetical protein
MEFLPYPSDCHVSINTQHQVKKFCVSGFLDKWMMDRWMDGWMDAQITTQIINDSANEHMNNFDMLSTMFQR